MAQARPETISGDIFNIQRFSLHDGPGIRTLVFLKGCPLRCPWCANPEGMVTGNQVKVDKRKCRDCGACASCSYGAVVQRDGYHATDPETCRGCGICIGKCRFRAREATRKTRTAAEVVAECARDTSFYREGGGGLTLGGGEPLFQPAFALAILRLARQQGLHTAIETTAFASPEVFQAAVSLCDTVHIDIKSLNRARHKAITGVDNGIILENIRRVTSDAAPTRPELIFRIPVVLGFTHDEEVIRSIGCWLLTQKRKDFRVELLPFHNLGEHKYEQLGLCYPLHGKPNLKPAEVEGHVAVLRDMGLEAHISSF